MARTNRRDVLEECEMQLVQSVNTILHFPGPHKLSGQLDAQMEYAFVQRRVKELAN